MFIIPEEAQHVDETYKDFLEDGRKFLKTARGGLRRPEVFTEEILYNILGMAIEKSIMGILMYHGTLADNHTFTDLLNSLQQVTEVDPKIVADLYEFESYQNLCPVFEGYETKKVSFDVIHRMLESASTIERQATETCGLQ